MLLAAVIADRRRTEESLRDTSGKLIDAQEQERHHIARELHDDIGQRLTLVELGLENAQEDCDSSLKPRLSELHDQVREISGPLTKCHTASILRIWNTWGLSPPFEGYVMMSDAKNRWTFISLQKACPNDSQRPSRCACIV